MRSIVSELTSLRYSDIYPKEGFIRVEGKGSKQRLVPISEVALREIKNYLYDRNSVVVKKGFEDILFLSRAEERLETARLMRSDGLSMEMVVRYTGLSEEEINNL